MGEHTTVSCGDSRFLQPARMPAMTWVAARGGPASEGHQGTKIAG